MAILTHQNIGEERVQLLQDAGGHNRNRSRYMLAAVASCAVLSGVIVIAARPGPQPTLGAAHSLNMEVCCLLSLNKSDSCGSCALPTQ